MHKGLVLFLVALACLDAVLGDTDCSGPHESAKCVSCPERTCADRDVPDNCQSYSTICMHRCVCDEEYYRSPSGDCLSYQECNYYS